MRTVKKHSCTCGQSNPELFYKTQKNRCKRCIVEKQRVDRNRDPEWEKANYRKHIIKIRVRCARQRAEKLGIDFTITEDDIRQKLLEQNNKCYYSGMEFDNTNFKTSISLDRVDNTKGYTPTNVVITTSYVNLMKLDASVEDFISVVKSIYENKVGQRLG
jgi:hypothetical protein